MGATAFEKGKSYCYGPGQLAAMGSLDSSRLAARKILGFSSMNRLNPLLLPKEVFHMIFGPLISSDKLTCLRLSKDWKIYLESEPRSWNHLEGRFSMKAVQLFSAKSRNALVSIDIEFSSIDKWNGVQSCFSFLKKSSNTLKSLKFTGYLEMGCLDRALDLAEQCVNLDDFEYTVEEDVDVSSSGDYGYEDDYKYRKRKLRKVQESHQELELDDYKFKRLPSRINICVSRYFTLVLGRAEFFSRAKSLTLNLRQIEYIYGEGGDGRLSRPELLTIMKVGSQNLRSLEILADGFLIIDDAVEEEVHLPLLRELVLKSWGKWRLAQDD